MFFAGRMIVQWIVSERHKRSVVPPIFWWLSVTGSAMLFTYFLWRRDIVGILGQGLPLLIYVRNLMLIYGRSKG
ncbi:MAG: lipid-A-disaccharide synthase N-terminal domain-containing protein [Phycisphaerae bacterium]|nr:lipid-A-disaccharide synthase N-terminal domain-containing protein [Phycisphaerae bacterium]